MFQNNRGLSHTYSHIIIYGINKIKDWVQKTFIPHEDYYTFLGDIYPPYIYQNRNIVVEGNKYHIKKIPNVSKPNNSLQPTTKFKNEQYELNYGIMTD